MEDSIYSASSFSMMSVQNHLQNIMKTHNHILDVFVSIIISMLFAFSMKYSDRLKNKWIIFWENNFSSEIYQILIPECKFTLNYGYLDNDDFNMMDWYVSEMIKKKTNVGNGVVSYNMSQQSMFDQTMNEERQNDSKKKYHTYSALEHQNYNVQFENHVIKISLELKCMKANVNPERNKMIKTWRLTYKSSKLIMKKSKNEQFEVLHAFLKMARKEYETFLESVKWEPKMFKYSKKNTDPKWISQQINNKKTFENVVLDASLQTYLFNDVVQFQKSKKRYDQLGVSYKRGYMLYGPPGTGKTSIILAISNQTKSDIYMLDLSKFNSDEDFENAIQQLPKKCVLVFEEIDTQTPVVHKRTSSLKEHTTHFNNNDDNSKQTQNSQSNNTGTGLTLGCILNIFDGIDSADGRILIITTNHPDKLDPALIRPGRIDVQCKLNLCTRDQIYRLFMLYYKDILSEAEQKKIKDIVKTTFLDHVLPAALISSVSLHFINSPFESLEELKKHRISPIV